MSHVPPSCNHDEPTDREFTPDEDLLLAERALSEGDAQHAAHHVAAALGAQPQRTECHAAVRALMAAGGDDPLALAPLGRSVYFGTVALRARMLHAQGDTGQAIGLTLALIPVRPDLPFYEWLTEW